jgi:predicted nucleic acid-binding protein
LTIFCDTTVLIAASVGGHPHHHESFAVVSAAQRREAFCALHTFAELYAVLTSMPGTPRLLPEDGQLILERLREVFAPVALTPREHFQTIADLAARRISGGRIYDALILRCAVKSGAGTIYSLNRRDFLAIAPELASRVRSP